VDGGLKLSVPVVNVEALDFLVLALNADPRAVAPSPSPSLPALNAAAAADERDAGAPPLHVACVPAVNAYGSFK